MQKLANGKSQLLAVVVALAVILTGCRTQASTPLPSDPAKRIAVANGILAEANNAATKATIQLYKSKVVSKDTLKELLEYNKRVAEASKSIALIQTQDRTLVEQKQQIANILKAITPRSFYQKYIALDDVKLATLAAAVTAIETAVSLLATEVSK